MRDGWRLLVSLWWSFHRGRHGYAAYRDNLQSIPNVEEDVDHGAGKTELVVHVSQVPGISC